MSNLRLKTKALSTITKKLLEDHKHMRVLLDELKVSLQEICQHQASQDLEKAQVKIKQLVLEMNTHAACEEEALFPALAKYNPMPILEVEHEEILIKRAVLLSGILNYNFPEDCTEELHKQGLEFFDLLERHLNKEETQVFPLVEQSLSPDEKFIVLSKMEEIRAKARAIPTPDISYPPKSCYQFHVPINDPIVQNIQILLLLEKEGQQLKSIGLQAGAFLSTHWSPKQVIIMLCSGEAEWRSPDTSLTIRTGDGLLMDPKLPHAIEAKTDCRFFVVMSEPPTL